MAFIGKEPQTGAYSMLDSLTASATASYSLTLDSVAFVPESANHLLVSLNGVIQKAGSSYTVSGSTLTFSSALTSSDSIDFVLALGNVLDIGTPSDATVTNAKTNFVSTSSSAGLDIKGDGTTAGTLRLMCEQGSHGIKLRSPAHSASQSYTLTFPTTAPSADKFLKTDGSGNLSFADAGGGGKINQVIQTAVTGVVELTSSSGTFVDITGFSASITPSASDSKVLVMVNVNYGGTGNIYGAVRLVRGSTAIGLGDASGSRTRASVSTSNNDFTKARSRGFDFLDSPSTTSATTYKLQVTLNGSQTFKLNTEGENLDNVANHRTISTITLMEVLA